MVKTFSSFTTKMYWQAVEKKKKKDFCIFSFQTNDIEKKCTFACIFMPQSRCTPRLRGSFWFMLLCNLYITSVSCESTEITGTRLKQDFLLSSLPCVLFEMYAVKTIGSTPWHLLGVHTNYNNGSIWSCFSLTFLPKLIDQSGLHSEEFIPLTCIVCSSEIKLWILIM